MKKGPARPDLIKNILKELKRNPEGIWIRKLARKLNEHPATIDKYIIREDYCGKYITAKKRRQELGGHLIIKLRKRYKCY